MKRDSGSEVRTRLEEVKNSAGGTAKPNLPTTTLTATRSPTYTQPPLLE